MDGKVGPEGCVFDDPSSPIISKIFAFCVGRRKYFQCVALPFGLSSAPRIFTKLMKPVVAYLRARGVRMVIYLDDMLFLHEQECGLRADILLAVTLIESLGFILNTEKSVLVPTRRIGFLGFILDTENFSLFRTEERIASFKILVNNLLKKSSVLMREVAQVLGKLSWTGAGVPWTPSHYRHLQRDYLRSGGASDDNLSKFISFSDSAREDLTWWRDNLAAGNGKKFWFSEPDVEIFSDASLSGWGASCNQVTSRGPWSQLESAKHINELDLLAALYALQAYTVNLTSISIRLYMDNSTAVAYVNHCG